jgi:NAD(P)-dependent dehydrogenase (short-subunit alcohol dehydrogenase family)
MKPLAVISGVGPGTGAALARRFHAGGHRVAMLARTADRLSALQAELPGSIAAPCDVADPEMLTQALQRIEDEAGPPAVVVHNAVGGAFGSFLEIEPEVLQTNFQVNVMALLHLARWAAPRMEAAGQGALIVTGNTASLRARPGSPASPPPRPPNASWRSPSPGRWVQRACTSPFCSSTPSSTFPGRASVTLTNPTTSSPSRRISRTRPGASHTSRDPPGRSSPKSGPSRKPGDPNAC